MFFNSISRIPPFFKSIDKTSLFNEDASNFNFESYGNEKKLFISSSTIWSSISYLFLIKSFCIKISGYPFGL